MGKLYEINQELMGWLDDAITGDDGMMINPETGEMLTQEEALQRIAELSADREQVMKWIAEMYLNATSEAAALKAEAERMKARADERSRKAEQLKGILDRECGGEKTDLGIVTVSYRKTSSVKYAEDDKKGIAVARWLIDNGHFGCVKVADPEPVKTEVSKLLKSGVEVPGAWIENSVSCSIK